MTRPELPLDYGVTVTAPDGTQGRVIDVFHESAFISGRECHWPVYVVQMPGYSTNLTARRAARDGWAVAP